ncbi:hypothetical protein PybrP1_000529 [[Pythium] brassicae (nom. inval.)]|nr:hypothetical protein PybrP1_000529 [[Pythium] brassicae (nom. inval.)]
MDSGERARHDFAKENRDAQLLNGSMSNRGPSAPPQPTLPSILHKDAEQPWRGSGGFGLANLLNRPPNAAGSSTQASSGGPLPKFSLPSLHAFGKLPKPELSVAKLKAEKKQGKAVDVSTLNDRYLSARGADSSSDVEQGSNTAPSSPASGGAKRSFDDSLDSSGSSPNKPTPRKKARQVAHGSSAQQVDMLDQEYIAAAATTLCFLMSQKIDSLFDARGDMDKDSLEPYDCYSAPPPAATAATAAASQPPSAGSVAGAGGDSRKRPYMHFLTESPVQYPADGSQFAYNENERADGYAIEGKKLYS